MDSYSFPMACHFMLPVLGNQFPKVRIPDHLCHLGFQVLGGGLKCPEVLDLPAKSLCCLRHVEPAVFTEGQGHVLDASVLIHVLDEKSLTPTPEVPPAGIQPPNS
jgi:hypothetical protein